MNFDPVFCMGCKDEIPAEIIRESHREILEQAPPELREALENAVKMHGEAVCPKCIKDRRVLFCRGCDCPVLALPPAEHVAEVIRYEQQFHKPYNEDEAIVLCVDCYKIAKAKDLARKN